MKGTSASSIDSVANAGKHQQMPPLHLDLVRGSLQYGQTVLRDVVRARRPAQIGRACFHRVCSVPDRHSPVLGIDQWPRGHCQNSRLVNRERRTACERDGGSARPPAGIGDIGDDANGHQKLTIFTFIFLRHLTFVALAISKDDEAKSNVRREVDNDDRT